ncbi:shikimate kinase [Chamaesiphon minutus]|uniref:Shikimate kinase n=1 Tax=Chamaesiphon minutus (strain ATCC 27169 / PCC 6605) TaxID=1173020 RepID=K9UQE4_CHAP6|nr:shikimate kinase [Chamaesiphon minutus]AFY96449.1 shikimate kinase [Chamaesiphon minutus PCC 6605]
MDLVEPIALAAPASILIGPTGAGKSTIGLLLSKRLNLPSVSMDGIAEPYYNECNFGIAVFQQLRAEQGFLATHRQWEPVRVYAVERVMSECGRVVLDLGAGHTHYENPVMFDRVKQAISSCPNVILLLPCADLDRSVRILKERCMSERGSDWIKDGYDFIAHWVKDSCNHDLATMTIFTEGKTPMETCEEIIDRMVTSSIEQNR